MLAGAVQRQRDLRQRERRPRLQLRRWLQPELELFECDAGYYEYPASSGLCVEDPCGGAACSGNGTCDNSTGSAVCTCDVGALLDDCSRCLRLVDPDATGANNGLTWADAYTNIQAALNDAWSTIGAGEAASCEVWVRSGVYYVYDTDFQSIVFGTNTDLYGGFAGDETERDQRDPEAYPTVLDGRSEGNPNLRASDGRHHGRRRRARRLHGDRGQRLRERRRRAAARERRLDHRQLQVREQHRHPRRCHLRDRPSQPCRRHHPGLELQRQLRR